MVEKVEEERPARLQMVDISHRFGDVQVLKGVDLRLGPGEVHALLGQNGAGKSTLIKVLGGSYPQHGGEILIDGETVRMVSPRAAMARGVSVIYQELSLVGSLTVAENVLLGIEPGGAGYSRASTLRRARELCSDIPLLAELPFGQQADRLSPGVRQRVEIAKAIAHRARIIVMDEPTARLSGPERAELYTLIRQLSATGIAVVYISHFLEESLEVCDAVTVLRNGAVVLQASIAGQSIASLTEAMLGTQLQAIETLLSERPPNESTSEAVLLLDNVAGGPLRGVSAGFHSGEIVGLAGLVGSGRTSLLRMIAGARPVVSGRILLGGRQARITSPSRALAHGIAMIPESRATEGVFVGQPARDNVLTMAIARRLQRYGIIARSTALREVESAFADLAISPHDLRLAIERFSGGNQQKLLFARVLLTRPEIILADQPTAGVDVGTKAQISRLLRDLADQGKCVVVASDDLDELLSISDRILVMRSGEVVNEYRRDPSREIDRAELVNAIAGGDI